ncbi:MAG: DUF4915 domain-containing protein [Steroidobacteraceae bacterium]
MRIPSEVLNPDELVLISCCNLGRYGSRYSLAVVTASGVSWLDLDEVVDPSTDVGIAGLIATEESCFLAMQGKRPRVVRLDHRLRIAASAELERAVDLHSLAERDGVLYAASTGRNEILSVDCRDGRFDGREQVHFCATRSNRDRDRVHLNSHCFVGDTLFFSMFGVDRGAPPRTGALVNAQTGAPIREGLRDPHSLTHLGDGMLAFCESLGSSFCLLDLETGALRRAELGGYARGCAFTGRHYIVGSSRWRHRSRSLGSFRSEPSFDDPHGNPWQRSSLYFLNPDLSVAHQLDFTHFAPEIYDVAYASTRFTADRVFEDAAARRLDAMYDEIHRKEAPARSRYSERA